MRARVAVIRATAAAAISRGMVLAIEARVAATSTSIRMPDEPFRKTKTVRCPRGRIKTRDGLSSDGLIFIKAGGTSA